MISINFKLPQHFVIDNEALSYSLEPAYRYLMKWKIN